MECPGSTQGLETRAATLEREVERLRHVERELRESEERYRSLVENTRDGFFMMEAASGRFLFLNRTICDLFGYSLGEGLGMSVWDVVVAEEHPALRERMVLQLAGGGPLPLRTWQVARRDGSLFQAEISVSGVSFQGRAVLQGLLRDVTERETLLERLSRSQKLEAVGTLASGVAHDFNNILQAISGYADLLLSRRGSPEERRDYVVQISRSTERAAELVRGLLAFSRRVEPTLRPLDINQVIEESTRVLERTIPRMIAIETALAADLWPVRADPVQLELVLLNLGINARDAMPEGGRLVVETRNVVLDAAAAAADPEARPGPHVLVRVSDEGHGMDRHTLAHAFDPFFTTKGVGEGTGLGLALAYGIVRSHGGAVTCHSAPGQGTTFELLFPAAVEETVAAEGQAAPSPSPPRGGETLLLVDDEESVVGALGEFLTRCGYAVVSAGSGEEALERYAAGGSVALVILDLGMAGMGGLQCLEELRRLDSGGPRARGERLRGRGPRPAGDRGRGRGFCPQALPARRGGEPGARDPRRPRALNRVRLHSSRSCILG